MAKLKKIGEANISPQVSANSMGEALKSARENKGLTLDDVYKRTKMYPKTLEAIENGHIDSTLGETYARAFLKDYATFLGIDARGF